MLPSVEVVWLLVEEVQLVVRGRAGYVDEDYRREKEKKLHNGVAAHGGELERMSWWKRCTTITGGDWRW
jgi:hypothetical protein